MSEPDIYEIALREAEQGLAEGGIPIGSALARAGELLGSGHNRRMQSADPTAHAEIDCLRRAGRIGSYTGVTLYSTLAPCFLCSGAILLFGIREVVVGEQRTFDGEGSLELLREHGVHIEVLDDPRARVLMQTFIAREPEVWLEDIGKQAPRPR